jgi:hypothetical protein
VRFAGTFLLLLAMCLVLVFDQGRATRFDHRGVRADASVAEVLPKLGDGDASKYVGIGHAIARSHRFPLRYRDDLNWWPPGMFLMNAALFAAFGSDMPVGIVIGTTMAVIWALLLALYVDFLSRFLHWIAVAATVAVLLLSAIMRDWFLSVGLFWSEGLYTVCILAALYAALRAAVAASERTRLGWAAGTGVLLGLSAYVRAVSDFLGWLMLVVVVVWAVVAGAHRFVSRRRAVAAGEATAVAPTWNRQLLALLLCAAAFQAVTVPWRVYAAQHLRPGDYGWSTAPARTWDDAWKPDAYYRQQGQRWLLDGRPNTACHVDPETCERIAAIELRRFRPYSGFGRYTDSDYRRLVVETIRDQPVEYFADRLTHLRRTWFWQPAVRSPEWLENTFLTLTVLAAVALSARRVVRSGPDLAALLYPGLLVANMLPFVTLHYEARYFATVKLVSVVTVVALVALDPPRLTRWRGSGSARRTPSRGRCGTRPPGPESSAPSPGSGGGRPAP